MFGTILEQSIFLYVIAATGICGIVAKLIMDGFLKGLVRGAGSMKSTKKKAINHQYLVKKVKKKNAASSHPREADCISLLSN